MSHPKLTQERIRELFDYDPETGNLIWKITTSNKKAKAGCIAGYSRCDGYRQVRINGKLYFAHRLIWLYVYGYFPENNIDHINRNPRDNRICNLREVSQQCNVRNTGNRKDNSTGVKGVYFIKSTKKWRACITANNKYYQIGVFEDFDEAACARLAVEQCLNWSGCNSKSPSYKHVKENIQGLK